MNNLIFQLILLSAVCCFHEALHGQSNLEFNDAKFIELSGSTPVGSNAVVDSVIFTVPIGKFWKIENANVGEFQIGFSSTPDNNGWLNLNDVPIVSYRTNASHQFPIWLPPDTYTLKLRGQGHSAISRSYRGYISAIEFNAVP